MSTTEILTIGGTVSTSMAIPEGWQSYGGSWRLYAEGRISQNPGWPGQLVSTTVCSGVTTTIISIDWVQNSNVEWGGCMIDTTQKGFAILIQNQSGLIRKEPYGSGDLTSCANLGMVAGPQQLKYVYKESDNTVVVFLNDVQIMNAVYDPDAEDAGGLRSGAQQYDQFDGVNFSGVSVETAGSGADITSLSSTMRPGTSYAAVTDGLEAWATATIGGKSLQISGSNLIVPAWTNGYIEVLVPGQSYPVVITDINGLSATAPRIYGAPIGYTQNKMGDGIAIDTGPDSIGKDPAIINDTIVLVPALGGGTMSNAGLFGDVPFGTYAGFWLRDLDNAMWQFSVAISQSSVSVDFDAIDDIIQLTAMPLGLLQLTAVGL